ncbi:hypothetical protein L484_005707 [Morus notabilis]|uniref:Uncharacterized protein n=1 Tax=Morus notabilis TaxID=981085 RepID=W9QHH9_9ROSA|nr:hypothetical protein L484_005707 [Morus notabilis]
MDMVPLLVRGMRPRRWAINSSLLLLITFVEVRHSRWQDLLQVHADEKVGVSGELFELSAGEQASDEEVGDPGELLRLSSARAKLDPRRHNPPRSGDRPPSNERERNSTEQNSDSPSPSQSREKRMDMVPLLVRGMRPRRWAINSSLLLLITFVEVRHSRWQDLLQVHADEKVGVSGELFELSAGEQASDEEVGDPGELLRLSSARAKLGTGG